MAVAAESGMDSLAWERCRRAGLDPGLVSPRNFCSEADLHQRRRSSPLSAVVDPIREALLRACSHEHVLILTDQWGNVIHRHGTAAGLRDAGQIGFEAGADWSEFSVGTNAISESLRLRAPAYVSGASHYAVSHARWTCMAAPITHPATGALLGVLDISGPRNQLTDDVVGMVKMTAALTAQMLHTETAAPDSDQLHMRLLSAEPAVRIGAGRWQRVSLRTAEILAVLSSRERGFAATELAHEIYGDQGKPVTVRSEIHRIRRRLGPIVSSEPYRLANLQGADSDVSRVEAALSAGDVDMVLEEYTQPLLPASSSDRILQWNAWLESQAAQLLADYGSRHQRSLWERTEMGWDAALQPGGPHFRSHR